MRGSRLDNVRGQVTHVHAMKIGDKFLLDCTVTETIYRGFIDLYGDRNPIHMDAAFAASKGFAGPVMHGNILGGFLSRLVGEELPVDNVLIQAQQISFRRPVYMGDTLRLTATVAEFFESVDSVELEFSFVNSEGTRVASGTILVGFLV
jgi:3-hydroxybutyryl-CoA dehydratase